MTDPDVEQASTAPEMPAGSPSARPVALVAFAVLSVGWVAYLLFGQVRARFWIAGEHQIAWKSIRRIWSVQLNDLPGGAAVEWLFAGSMLVFVVGVIAGLYLLLLAPEGEAGPQEG